jgi:integrase
MAKGLTDLGVKHLRAGVERREVPDPGQRGLYVIIQPSGRRRYAVRFRFHGRPCKLTLPAGITLAAARKAAAAALFEVSEGRNPAQARKDARVQAEIAAADTVRAISEQYLAREGKKLRTVDERRAILNRLVYPEFGGRPISSIRRSEIVRLLDRVEDKNGPRMADITLAVIRKIMGWHALRSDGFNSPIVRGMARAKPQERARDRVLADHELQIIWRVAEERKGPYDRMLQFIVLTATRLREAARMNRSELEAADTWVIPRSRYKSNIDHVIPLSKKAQELLSAMPVIGDAGWVFTTGGDVAIAGFSKAKKQFDERVLAGLRKHDPQAKPLPHWTPHDLRRTARTLMSRAGVDPDHAERALGHVIPGIRGNYDKHQFRDEKRVAFEKVALLVERIVDPPPQGNVVELRRG